MDTITFFGHEPRFRIQTAIRDSDRAKPVLELLTVCLDSLQYLYLFDQHCLSQIKISHDDTHEYKPYVVRVRVFSVVLLIWLVLFPYIFRQSYDMYWLIELKAVCSDLSVTWSISFWFNVWGRSQDAGRSRSLMDGPLPPVGEAMGYWLSKWSWNLKWSLKWRSDFDKFSKKRF